MKRALSGLKFLSRQSRVSRLTGALLGVASLGFAAAGCEAIRNGANPEMPLWLQRPNAAMQVNYTRKLVAPSRRAGEPYERGQPEIDPVGKRVFTGSSDEGLYALRAANGEQIWRFETLGFVQCAPLYDPVEDVVYFGSNDGAFYKVAAKGRQTALALHVQRRGLRAARSCKTAYLYVVNANDTLLALEPDTGKVRWSQQSLTGDGHGGSPATRARPYSAAKCVHRFQRRQRGSRTMR